MIPTFKAKKIDSDDYVEGAVLTIDELYYIPNLLEDVKSNGLGTTFIDYCNLDEIDLLTLQISFGNEKWFTMEEAEMAFNKAWDEGF